MTNFDWKSNIIFEFSRKNWPRRNLFPIFLTNIIRNIVFRDFFVYMVRGQNPPVQKLGYSSYVKYVNTYEYVSGPEAEMKTS